MQANSRYTSEVQWRIQTNRSEYVFCTMHFNIIVQYNQTKCAFLKLLYSFLRCLLHVSNPRVHLQDNGCAYTYGTICLMWINFTITVRGRRLCDELITRPEESYRLWCVVMCDLETSWMGRPWPIGGRCAKKNCTYCATVFLKMNPRVWNM